MRRGNEQAYARQRTRAQHAQQRLQPSCLHKGPKLVNDFVPYLPGVGRRAGRLHRNGSGQHGGKNPFGTIRMGSPPSVRIAPKEAAPHVTLATARFRKGEKAIPCGETAAAYRQTAWGARAATRKSSWSSCHRNAGTATKNSRHKSCRNCNRCCTPAGSRDCSRNRSLRSRW